MLTTKQVAHIKQHIKTTIKERTLALIKSGINECYAIESALYKQYAKELNFAIFNIDCETDFWFKTKINLVILVRNTCAGLRKKGLICYNRKVCKWVAL
jgi:hypothetical protein